MEKSVIQIIRLFLTIFEFQMRKEIEREYWEYFTEWWKIIQELVLKIIHSHMNKAQQILLGVLKANIPSLPHPQKHPGISVISDYKTQRRC